MSDPSQKSTGVNRQAEVQRTADNVEIKHEKPDESTLVADCGALVKQEPLDGDCTETCPNVYDSVSQTLFCHGPPEPAQATGSSPADFALTLDTSLTKEHTTTDSKMEEASSVKQNDLNQRTQQTLNKDNHTDNREMNTEDGAPGGSVARRGDTRTGETLFCCHHCLYQTGYKRYLVTHMRTHTGEKPHSCRRGARVRGGSAGGTTDVRPPAPAVASAAPGHAGRGRGRRRGVRRTHVIDNLQLVGIHEYPVGDPLETPLTNKRRRRWNPKSAAMPTVPSTSTAIDASAPPSPGINSAAMPAVPSTSTAFDAPAPPSPGLFLESREEQELSVPVRQPRNQRGLLDDDTEFLLNYGSEPDCDTDDDDEPLLTRRAVAFMDTPVDPVDVISSQPLGTSRRSTDVDDGAAAALPTISTSSSGAIGPNFLDFEWRAFPETPINPKERREKFSNSNVGPTVPYVDPYDIFIAIWDRQIMEHIVTETNRYAEELLQQLTLNNALGPHSRLREWRNTTTDELYTYFAIVLAMGCVVKQRYEAYWSADLNILSTQGFRAHMSLRRFQLLNRCLHFNRNERLSALSPESAEAKKFKIEPVATHLNNKFQQLYNLQQNIALDESLLQWKGWLEIAQHIPNKAAAIGVKTYEVCESRTGYLWRFDIHAHKRSQHQASNESNDPLDAFTSTLVLKLLKGLENKGHTVWMDNFYNSPALARKLKTLGFDCVGTLRTNRQFVPEVLSQLTKENMRPGTIAGLTAGDVDVMVWRDRNRVATISTYHGNAVAVKEGTTKPTMILDYNVMMGGVDKKDQMLAGYPVERKRTKIWYKKLFRRLLNVSVLNSYIISKKNSSSLDHGLFREALIFALIDKHCTQREFSKPIPDTLSLIHHHLTEHPFKDGRRTRRLCVLCKKRIQTYCVGCDKTLCMTPCFVDHHRALER